MSHPLSGNPSSVRALRFLFLLCLVSAAASVRAAGYGFDAGQSLADYVRSIDAAGVTGANGTWLRARGITEVDGQGDEARRAQAEERRAIQSLHERGVRVCVILRWAPAVWTRGVRAGGGQRLPLDLREAYERGRRLGAAYGDVVDVWEIENEPDIDFVAENPETHAAFQKAIYLGLHAGAAVVRSRNSEAADLRFGSSWRALKTGRSDFAGVLFPASARPVTPRVVMAPLALPPGAYLERLWANGLAGYTDGFNFHYYGYAEDFTGVYRQFEDAVGRAHGSGPGVRKSWPVFITEYGYGMLSADARDTVEGRVRQWRWFASLAGQLRDLRPEGPMAFLLNPYYEADLNEFGLLMKTKPEGFAPADFGLRSAQPWMACIGEKVGEDRVSPALAYLWDFAKRRPYRARDWTVRTEPPSPVVLDLAADADMTQLKRSGGYVLTGAPVEWSPVTIFTGRARLLVYNFGTEAVAGKLVFADPSVVVAPADLNLTLAPGERREVPVELRISGRAWRTYALGVRFEPASAAGGASVFRTLLYPDTDAMRPTPVAGFEFSAESNRARQAALLARPRAAGEQVMHADGRWLATDGVRVEERDGVWRFHIDYLPAEPLRPAAVELPLPEGFKFDAGTSLLLERRMVLGESSRANLPAGLDALRLKPRAGLAGDMMDVYFRTENGNLYQTWPRLRAGPEWAGYAEHAENFSMAFFGRAELPWRFAGNRPAALVFFLRTSRVPAVFEVRNARIVRIEEAGN